MTVEAPRPEEAGKLYYSIREVSDLLDVKPHVLRYWESQFRMLRPKKSRAGNRMYRPKDVDLLREIQRLLHVRRYTIAGARQELLRRRRADYVPDESMGDEYELEAGAAGDTAFEGLDGEEDTYGESSPGARGSIRTSANDEDEVDGDEADGDSREGTHGVVRESGSHSGSAPREHAPSAYHHSGSGMVRGHRPVGPEDDLELFPHHEPAGHSGGDTRDGSPRGSSRGHRSQHGETSDGTPARMSAAELAPLREEIRQLKEWLEAGIVGARNRG